MWTYVVSFLSLCLHQKPIVYNFFVNHFIIKFPIGSSLSVSEFTSSMQINEKQQKLHAALRTTCQTNTLYFERKHLVSSTIP